MAKFRAKPKEIEAVLVRGLSDVVPKILSLSFSDTFIIWNNLHGKWIEFDVPCWINITDLNDPYPIHPTFMTANYEQIDGQ